MNEQQPPLPPDPRSRPHPVTFDVEYSERLSRWLIFVKWLLVIPQGIITYLLLQVSGLLGLVAWFAILFTGSYPQSMHQFAVGVQRWAANVGGYIFLLRDEYPPFTFDQGKYPLTLDIPYPERQSRWRLFIRFFAIIPNQIVFFFVQIAWTFTMFFAWFAILIIGRYPRGLFNFSVGVQRWWHRSSAYTYLLRDEYPPYSTRADARPGNEVISAIIGFPLFAALVAAYIAWTALLFSQGGETERFARSLLVTPSQVAEEQPSVKAGSLRITLTAAEDEVPCPDDPGVCVRFDVLAEKDGFVPAFFTPYLFSAELCPGPGLSTELSDSPEAVGGDDFQFFFRDGSTRSAIYFFSPATEYCALEYFTGSGFIRFEFE